jgi:hypothetical protein
MSDEPHLPDENNEDELSAEVIDENDLEAEAIEKSSEDTLDKLSSKIEATEASAEILDEAEVGGEETSPEIPLDADRSSDDIDLDSVKASPEEAETDVEVLVKKSPSPAPLPPRKPQWKQHLEEMRAEEVAKKQALIDERRAYEESIRAGKEAHDAARREEFDKAQEGFKTDWQSKQSERDAQKAATMERARQEREAREQEMAARKRGDFTYPKPEPKQAYPSPSRLESAGTAEKEVPQPPKPEKETPTIEKTPEKESPKSETPQNPTAPSKPEKGKKPPKDKAAPKKEDAKKGGDELENRISRLSKPEE